MRRWLIDTDQDDAGMRVIVDLHGGDPEDLQAKAEFQEIKDRVIFEVGPIPEAAILTILSCPSVNLGMAARTRLCGGGINGVFCWRCPRRLLPS